MNSDKIEAVDANPDKIFALKIEVNKKQVFIHKKSEFKVASKRKKKSPTPENVLA